MELKYCGGIGIAEEWPQSDGDLAVLEGAVIHAISCNFECVGIAGMLKFKHDKKLTRVYRIGLNYRGCEVVELTILLCCEWTNQQQ